MVCAIRKFALDRRISAPDELTVSAVEGYVADLFAAGLAPKTITNRLSALDRFCDFLYARGLLLSNPARAVARPRAKETAPAEGAQPGAPGERTKPG